MQEMYSCIPGEGVMVVLHGAPMWLLRGRVLEAKRGLERRGDRLFTLKVFHWDFEHGVLIVFLSTT
ncbi:MAG: hypothetical protein AAB898_01480 [Patescibacteria group bacterium]